MADNVVLPASGTGDATPKVTSEQVVADGSQKQIVELGVPGTGRTLIPGDVANGLDVDVTRVSGTVAVSGPLTDTQLRLTPVPVTIPTPTPVTDNAGSLTVDAPVATPVAARLSDGIAFIDPRDVSDRAARLVGVVSGGANVFHVDDNAGSVTVDAPVATPVFVRLSDGTAALIGQKAMAASVPVVIASDQGTLPAVSEQRAATLHVTATAAVNTAVTLTLPAPAAGLFHYITSIQIVKLYSVVGVASGAGVIITSTNLPGTPAWTTEQLASAAGSAPTVLDYKPATPLKSAVAATATTIVCPLQLQTIWRVNVSYFTAV